MTYKTKGVCSREINFEVEDNKVTVSVGSVEHPMTEAHYITLIVLETKNGTQFKQLTPTDKPEAVFYIGEGDEVVAAYDYCNLHGFYNRFSFSALYAIKR